MALLYYEALLALSLIFTLIYTAFWHKHFDVHFTLLFGFIPVANLGYVLRALSDSLEAALTANKIIYIGGCFHMLFILFAVFSICRIELKRPVHVALFTFNVLIYICMLDFGHTGYYYKNVTFERIGDNVLLHKEYGPLHTVFVVMIAAYFAVSLGVLIYSYFRKKDVSRKLLYLLFLAELFSVGSYFVGRLFIKSIDLVPLSYVISQGMFLIVIHRSCLYALDDTVADSLLQSGDTGFISVDFKYHYLGSNETAKRIFPELKNLTVDKPIARDEKMRSTAMEWLKEFREDERQDKTYYQSGDHIYLVDVNYLYDSRRKRGYQFVITDDTKNQRYISLLGRYNTDLRKEAAEKTAHILEMHDKLVLSMATMVESRDNSTGGHIRRTSEVVRILIDEIMKNNTLHLTPDFCRAIIKAAPMHDLGKIAVDDAILRKPGRFTDEEFEKMKTHAAEGARIVHEILEGTVDADFSRIAENVAHYHHERWDGSGYPEGLRGEEIPLEARIMAVADVYDALVSKRVYKERMSFEKANAIIMDGMGKHFDKQLEPYYVNARPMLEAYYSGLEG